MTFLIYENVSLLYVQFSRNNMYTSNYQLVTDNKRIRNHYYDETFFAIHESHVVVVSDYCKHAHSGAMSS